MLHFLTFENIIKHRELTENWLALPQSAITCSKSTIETQKQGVKYVQS